MAVVTTVGCKRKSAESTVSNRIAKQPRTSHSKGSPQLTLSVDDVHRPISEAQLVDLLLFASLGKKYNVKQPDWCHVSHQKNISAVNITVLEGLTQLHFYTHYMQFKNLRKRYNIRCSFVPNTDSLPSRVLKYQLGSSQCASSPTSKNTLNSEKKDLSWHPVVRRYGSKTRGLTRYLLSQEDMIRKAFPVKGAPGYESFICTKSDENVTDSSPLYGLDCEMCLTGCGSELTRVSLVDSDGTCLLDELVKPENQILNYLTRHSGITKAMLTPVKTRLKDVQAKVIQALPRDAVLVGHSLENDLRALKLIHPHVIDVSLLYRKEFGQKFKLKYLAEAVLHKQIQSEERVGHHPTEDALAALELAQYFISEGPQKVAELDLDGEWSRHNATREEAIGGTMGGQEHYISFTDALKAAGQSALHIRGGGKNGMNCSSDEEVMSTYRSSLPSHFFSIVEFSSLTELVKTSTESNGLCDYLHKIREMSTVYAGPLCRDYTVKSVRRLFRHCGPVRSVRLLDGIQGVHAAVEFEMLEGAHLAIKSLDGHEPDGHFVKVRRPVKESTLDLELTLRALESDTLNRNVIYVTGLSEPVLYETFSQFGQIVCIIVPKRSLSRKRRKDAFIKYLDAGSAEAALQASIQVKGREVMTCKALSPWHLLSWLGHTVPRPVQGSETLHTPAVAQWRGDADQQPHETEVKNMIRKLDKMVGKLFKSLPDNTLSVVLLPGLTSASMDFLGLCLIGVKDGTAV